MKVLLCSQSSIKLDAVTNSLKNHENNISIDCMDCDELGLPPQPYGCTYECAKARLDFCKEKVWNEGKRYDMIVSVENGLVHMPYGLVDQCAVVLEWKGILRKGNSQVPVPYFLSHLLNGLTLVKYNDNIQGYIVTLGEKIKECSGMGNIDPKNWMRDLVHCDRRDMIRKALINTWKHIESTKKKIDKVVGMYKEYPDFPKPGVTFQDIFPVLSDPTSMKDLTDLLVDRYQLDEFDYVVGLESRGFFGILLAQAKEVGFIPIRKAGKLPGETEQIEYGTEYSKDKMEISKDIPSGSRVLIFDDLIATGGSLKAAVDLVERLGCIVTDCCVLREVKSLKQKARETLQRSYTVLLTSL